MAWYPKLTDKESDKFHKATREKLQDMIKKITGISMAEYPEEEELYVWKVARYIKGKQYLS